MVSPSSPMDRASTSSLTAKRVGLHLTSPCCKSNWWVVAGDLSGLPDPQVLLGLLDPPAPRELREPQALLERQVRQDELGPRVLRVLLARRARRASKAQPDLRV